MNSGMEIYLRATPSLDAGHERIVETARGVTQGCSSDEEKAVRLFYLVRDSITYSMYMIMSL